MMTFLIHPDFIELSRYADDELDGQELARMEAHLHGCANCRAELDFIRALGATARALPAPGPSEDALDRVLARRAAGERVIVPVSGSVRVEAKSRGFLRLAAAITGPLIAAAAIALILAPGAEADRGRLEFSDVTPEPGQTLDVEYRTGQLFEGEARLILRGQFRYEGGTTEIRPAAELTRVDDGVYRARLPLSDSLAYAAFAVEDPSADRVDSNSRRLWEVVAHGPDGKPTFAALRQRAEDMVGRNLEVAYRTAVRMTELYPDEAYGWYAALLFGRQVLAHGGGEAVRQRHLRAHRHLAGLAPQKGQEWLGWAVNYGRMLGVEDAQEHLEEELRRRAPDHPVLIVLRVGELREGGRLPPLDTLEALWRRASDLQSRRAVVIPGYQAALRGEDTHLVERWVDRLLQVSEEGSRTHLRVAEQLAVEPSTAELGLSQLRAILADLERPGAAARPLVESRSAYRFASDRRAQRVLASIGAALVARGETRGGLDTLRMAAEKGWDPTVFERAAATLQASGDTTAALEYMARLAVDPRTSAATREAVVRTASAYLPADRWEALLASAERAMSAMVLANGVRRHIPDDLELTSLSGTRLRLADVSTGTPTVVAFWNRKGATSLMDLPRLREATAVVARTGGRVVVVTDERRSADLQAFLAEHAPDLPVYIDTTGEVARAFGQWGTPEYFVLDADGVIRFEYSELEWVARQVAVLLPRSAAPPLADD